MKHFEVLLLDEPSQVIEVRDTDTPEAWWAANVVNNQNRYVTLNGTSHPLSQLTDVQDAKPRKGLPGDLYQLLLVVDGQGVWTFFAETHEEAEQRGKRVVKTERKKGINMTMHIVHTKDVVDEIRQAFLGKGFNKPQVN